MASSSPFDDIVQAVPAFGTALKLHGAGDLAKARAAYLELIDDPALTAACLHQLGMIAAAKGQHGRAAELFGRAVRLDPALVIARLNYSAALDRAGNPAGAAAALIELGCMLQMAGRRHDEAAAIYRRVLERDPLNYPAHVNLGTALVLLDQSAAAVPHLLTATMLYGRLFVEVGVFARGIARRLRDRIDGLPKPESLPQGPPNGAIEKIEEALTTLGKALTELGCAEEALACHRMSVGLSPGYALGHWNLALALLTAGEFASGWRDYEWRWRWPDFPEPRRRLPVPSWRGGAIAGKRIVVWAEQGYGDAIQFAPLVHKLAEKAGEVLLEAPTPLVRLFRGSFPGLTVIGRPDAPDKLAADPLPDLAVPLMSLPQRLGLSLKDLPLACGYLRAADGDAAAWAERIPPGDGLSAGLVWAGRLAHANDAKRSLAFGTLAPLFDSPGVRWYSLQVGAAQDDPVRAGAPVTPLHPHIKDFADTAAAIGRLGLVITIDSAVAHLAGAMGKPVWLLLPRISDWRWGNDGSPRPWYPAMRVFRQQSPGDWPGVIATVRAELARREETL